MTRRVVLRVPIVIGSDSNNDSDGGSAILWTSRLYLSWTAKRVDYGLEGSDLFGHCLGMKRLGRKEEVMTDRLASEQNNGRNTRRMTDLDGLKYAAMGTAGYT